MGQDTNTFLGIRKVALEIAYDNGMINRDSPEETFLMRVDEILGADGVDFADLRLVDDWILTLTDEEVSTLAAGEREDMDVLEQKFSRPELLRLLDDIFEVPM